jgi:hypothetical protein
VRYDPVWVVRCQRVKCVFVGGHQMTETCWRRNKQSLLCSGGYCSSMENELMLAWPTRFEHCSCRRTANTDFTFSFAPVIDLCFTKLQIDRV